MPPLNVYAQAAQLIGEWREVYSCLAIARVCDSEPTKLRLPFVAQKYADLFCPEDRGYSAAFWLDRATMPNGERREWRLTALCFAAAMHDTGDL